MSEQTDQNAAKPAAQDPNGKPAAKTEKAAPSDATPAAAALARAVKSAEKTAASAGPVAAEPSRSDGAWRRTGAWAAAFAAAVGFGWFGGAQLVSGGGATQAALTQWSEANAGIRQSHEDVVRLTGDVRALKVAIDALKEGVERVRNESVGKQSQLMERLDRLDRVAQDSSGKASRVAEQLERLANVDRDPIKLAPLAERLDRIEKQASTAVPKTAAAAPAATPEPGQTGSIDAKPQTPKQAPLEGWLLRDIYDGVALLEGPNRRLIEVSPGQAVGAIGRVEAFERRGKAWVVVTSKGVIGTERWQ